MSENKFFKFMKSFREGTLILIIVVLSIVMGIISESFFTTGNIRATVLSFAIDGFVVMGMTLVLISGGLDLSVGSIIALVGTLVGQMYLVAGVNIWVAVILGLILSLIFGAINGFFITKIGLNPLITTLGSMAIFRGGAYVVTKGIPLSLYKVPDSFKFLGRGDILGVPFVIIIFFIMVIILDYLFRKSTFLRKVFYVGSNPQAAKFSGIGVNKVKMSVYLASGLLAGIAGIFSISRFATATPTLSMDANMTAIAACVIGGCSITGGEGSIFGAVLGIALLAIINSSLILLDVPVYYQQLISGAILLFAVSLDYMSHKKKNKK